MRLLLITKTDPTLPRDGGTIRVSMIIQQLRAAGFDVLTIAIRSDTPRRRPSSVRAVVFAFATLFRSLMTLSPSIVRWFSFSRASQIHDAILRTPPDLILVEFSQLAPYAHSWGHLVAYDLHNIEHELVGNFARSAKSPVVRAIAQIDSYFLRRYERKLARARRPTIVVGRHDLSIWVSLGGDRDATVVAPNGVSDEAFAVVRSPQAPPLFVFIGHLGWQPNVDAAKWLVKEVFPRLRHRMPTARVALVGRSPSAPVRALALIDGVEVHGDVASPLPYLARATAATAPLLSAGGTRLKILEALGSGTPVVSTTLGALGLEELAKEGQLCIADTPDDFAQRLYDIAAQHLTAAEVRAAVQPFRWCDSLSPAVELLASAIVQSAHPRVNSSPAQSAGDEVGFSRGRGTPKRPSRRQTSGRAYSDD